MNEKEKLAAAFVRFSKHTVSLKSPQSRLLNFLDVQNGVKA